MDIKFWPAVGLFAVFGFATSSALAFPRPHALEQKTKPVVIEIKVFGKDTRRRVPKEYRALAQGIGAIVDTANKFSCTAFCVADNVIVTNAHCIAWGAKKRSLKTRSLKKFSFRLFRDGSVDKKTPLQWNNIAPIANPYLSVLGQRPVKNWQLYMYRDWMAAKLKRKICAGRSLAFASESTIASVGRPGGLNAFMIGFHNDKVKKSIRHSYSKCAIAYVHRNGANALALHTCDATALASGSPIFTATPDGPRVVGFHRGSTDLKRRRSRRIGSGPERTYKHINIAILPFTLVWKLPRFRDATFIAQPVEMKLLARQLKTLGYLNRDASEQFGIAISDAITKFEREKFGVPLGIPTQELMRELSAAIKADGRGK